MDLIAKAWAADPGMHVYHFNHYEPTAFKKLAGRYVTREEPLNELLRAERFVDLYPIVRQAARCGVESYSIKKLEPYYGYVRRVELKSVVAAADGGGAGAGVAGARRHHERDPRGGAGLQRRRLPIDRRTARLAGAAAGRRRWPRATRSRGRR